MKRQATQVLVALIVALVGATACSAAGTTPDAQGPGDGATDFCTAWDALGPTPSVNDAAGALAWAERARSLLEVTPPRHRPAVEHMARTAGGFVELGERAGWTSDGFGALSGHQQEEMARQADDLGLFFTGPVARYAHQTCPGTPDPAFQLSCIGHRSFLHGGRGDQIGGEPGEGTVPPATTVDPTGEATTRLPLLPEAVEVRQQHDGGSLELSFVDGDGRALRLERYQLAGTGWALVGATDCSAGV